MFLNRYKVIWIEKEKQDLVIKSYKETLKARRKILCREF